MKKILLSILTVMLVLGLTGCSGKTEKVDEANKEVVLDGVTIVSPTGAPALAFYKHAADEAFETNSAPKNIVAMMADENGPDFVVIDTVSGSAAISKGAPYKLAAVLTFGNFYLVSTGNDEDEEMNADDKILLFGEGQTPDMVFHYLYGEDHDENITFVPAVADAAAVLQNGEGKDIEGNAYDYVFAAQPVLFGAMKANEKLAIYADIQKEYANKSDSTLIQASLFVSDRINDETLSAFLSALESDVNEALADPSVIVTALNAIDPEEAKAKYGVPGELASAVIKQNNGLGLGFKKASEIKDDIDAFMKVMGKGATDEAIYR